MLDAQIQSEMVLRDPTSLREKLEIEHVYDVFKRRAGGHPFLITTVDNLEEARERTTHCALVVPGEYFIYSQSEGIILECVAPEKKDRRIAGPVWLIPRSWNFISHATVT
jgi:hypothetical protein